MKILKKFLLVEVWNIGIANCNISQFLTIPNQKIHWLRPASLKNFRADPFGYIDENGKKFVYFESYDFTKRRGKISALELDDQLKIISEKEVLSKDKHLSYPYIFFDGEVRYALVESYKSHQLILYKISENQTFEKVKVIFENLSVVDPSIVKFNDKWWLFFSLNESGDDKLYLAYSDDLLGEWKMHPKNPIKSDLSSARMAGEIFLHEGALYRPSQNCLKNYGASIIINKIAKLDVDDYEENYEIEITPNQVGRYPEGLHTISSLGENLTLIDGKRKVFVFYKPVLSLLRKFLKNFSC